MLTLIREFKVNPGALCSLHITVSISVLHTDDSGSTPLASTIFVAITQWLVWLPSKQLIRVQFPLAAPIKIISTTP